MGKKIILIFLAACIVGVVASASIVIIKVRLNESNRIAAVYDREYTESLVSQTAAIDTVSSTLPKTELKKPDVHFGILMYHQVDDHPPTKQLRFTVSPSIFEQQISFLLDHGYTFVTVDRALDLFAASSTPPNKTLVLTFDDGYRSFYTNVFPLLKKYNIPATEYVITQDIGKRGSLTWDMLKELQASGLVEIGAHTVNHLSLKALSEDKQRYQLGESKLVLEKGLGHPVTTVAYPFGLHSAATRKIAEEIGFKGAVGIFSGDKPTGGKKFACRRVGRGPC
jgi:peptidoglycan/xylan/chitin deacetylase (PgdA/CDA1 family)